MARLLVEKEEKECTEKAEEAQELKDSCEKDLAEALPALAVGGGAYMYIYPIDLALWIGLCWARVCQFCI